mmetsp:Transcript_41275/g.76813  ORF Transcript_41275/g.76813 Transcript_41275/m.76813 type:complete len:201 (-) Transcript_41275:64-666(-)
MALSCSNEQMSRFLQELKHSCTHLHPVSILIRVPFSQQLLERFLLLIGGNVHLLNLFQALHGLCFRGRDLIRLDVGVLCRMVPACTPTPTAGVARGRARARRRRGRLLLWRWLVSTRNGLRNLLGCSKTFLRTTQGLQRVASIATTFHDEVLAPAGANPSLPGILLLLALGHPCRDLRIDVVIVLLLPLVVTGARTRAGA